MTVLAALVLGFVSGGLFGIWTRLLDVYRSIHRHEPELAYLFLVTLSAFTLVGLAVICGTSAP